MPLIILLKLLSLTKLNTKYGGLTLTGQTESGIGPTGPLGTSRGHGAWRNYQQYH